MVRALPLCRRVRNSPEDPAWVPGYPMVLGSMNENLPSLWCLKPRVKEANHWSQTLGKRIFTLKHAGTRFRADKDAILYLQ